MAYKGQYDGLVNAAAHRYGVPAALILAIAHHETGGTFNPNATNRTGGDGLRGGSFGLMQMSLATAKLFRADVTEDDLKTPATNLDIGTRFLADLLRAAARGGYGIDSAVSSYNAGNSKYRAGDGPRKGIDRGTPSQARAFPFINQATYVNPVLKLYAEYQARGYSTDAPAYSAPAKRRAGPSGAGFGLLVILLAAVAGLALPISR